MTRRRTVVAAALMAAVLAGCDPAAAPTATPTVPSVPPSPTEDPEIAELRARQLVLPELAAGGECPIAERVEITPAPPPEGPVASSGTHRYGRAPVFPLALHFDNDQLSVLLPEEPWRNAPPGWYVAGVRWASEPGYRGPVLFRASRIDGPGRARVVVTSLAAPEYGSDVMRVTEDWQFFPGIVAVTAPGCYAFQLDGPSFTEVIVFRAERAA